MDNIKRSVDRNPNDNSPLIILGTDFKVSIKRIL